MDKDSFILYGRQAQALTDLTLEQKGMLLDALFSYANTRVQPEFDDIALTVAFRFLSLQINVDSDRYEEICKKRAEAGRRGMASRWKNNDNNSNESITKITNITNVTKDNKDNHNDNDNDNDNESTDVDNNKKKDNKEKASGDADDLSFEIFWEAYGNKKDRKHSLSAWNRLSKKDKKAALDGIQPYKDDCKRCDRTMKYPATYLNGRTWEDDFSASQDKAQQPTVDEFPAGMDAEKWKKAQDWMKKFTPRIMSDIDPDRFLTMRAMAHRKVDIFMEILGEIDKSDYVGDIPKEFQRLAQDERYFFRIQA